MSYSFVSATGVIGSQAGIVVPAGSQIIAMMYDSSGQNSTMSVSDTVNTYTNRGTINNNFFGGTIGLADCLTPVAGTYTVTINTTGVDSWGVVMVYSGLASFSAGSFHSKFTGTSVPSSTDGLTTTAISATAYPAAIIAFGSSAGTVAAGTGFASRIATAAGFAFGLAACGEDMELLSGSHAATFTCSGTLTNGGIVSAAYLEGASASAPNLLILTQG